MARRTAAPADPKLVVGYVRASTEQQELGPDAQHAALTRWCKAQGAVLAIVHEDLGVSGGADLDRRPGLLAAIEELRTRRAGVLLVSRRDRLARDVILAATIERLVEREGARVMSSDGAGNGDGPEASLMRTIIDAVASYERAVIKLRTKAALGVKKARGERTGEVPFGQQLAVDGIHLEADEHEQAVVAEVLELRRAGHSIRGIATTLNELERPARGGRWHPTSVARLLRRAAS